MSENVVVEVQRGTARAKIAMGKMPTAEISGMLMILAQTADLMRDGK